MNTKYLSQFEKYYNGEMEPEEKAVFERSLSEDPELNASFKEYLSIYDAISDKDTIDLRIKLREIREENARKKDHGDFFSFGYNWIWMAALMTIIISFTVIVSLMIAGMDRKEQIASELNAIEVHDNSGLDRELMRFARRHSDFRIESPRDSIFFNRKVPLAFRWTVDSTDPLILELIGWDGRILFSSGKPVSSPYVVKMKLPSGLIAYRFRTETEAYFIGFLLLK